MHLKSIEFIGFKSFAQKTSLTFPGGIAAVVGPNGSGKSNVIDGIRWVLGEREAKNLRGAKAENLIFSGTPKRSRMGMAQVTIVFDNSSGFFPVDFNEVSIVRRIDRDGTSEYFLNKSSVRLKDVVDFFAKSRLGTQGLSIINQGDSDLFVRAAPEERRVMLEEVLGLRQYQLKKHEAERKLKNTSINLEKVRAMLDEIIPHLKFLKRQTAKWEKVGELEKELKELENFYFGSKLKEINDGIKKFDPEIKSIGQAIAARTAELKLLDEELRKVESIKPSVNRVGDARIKRESLLNERQRLEREISRLEAKIELIHSMASAEKMDFKTGELLSVLEEVGDSLKKLLADKNLEKVYDELENLLLKVKQATDKPSKRGEEINDLKVAKDDLIEKLKPISEELKNLSDVEEKTTENLEKFNEEFRQAFEKVEKKKDEIAEFENAKNKVNFEVERFRYRRQDLESQISQFGRNIKDFENFSGEIISEDLQEAERKILKLRSELAGIGEVDQALIKEAGETESRHEFLSTQLRDLEKATFDLENLIKELDVKIHNDFTTALKAINEEFNKFFELMFGGGHAKMKLEVIQPINNMNLEEGSDVLENEKVLKSDEEDDDLENRKLQAGIELEVSLPRKKIKGLDMLSGGEKSLVSIAALFALISVSPPPFLVLDEVDAALDERNTKRFADLIKNFSKKSQFILVTHNRATMEAADVLYGVTMEEDGVSKVLSIKLS